MKKTLGFLFVAVFAVFIFKMRSPSTGSGAANASSGPELRPQAYDSPVGSRVVYRVYQDRLPILGMEIEIEIDRDNRAQLVRNEYRAVKRVALSKLHVLSVEQILNQGTERLGVPNVSAAPASVLYLAPQADEPELAYAVSFQGKGVRARGTQALFRATDGQLLARTASRSEF